MLTFCYVIIFVKKVLVKYKSGVLQLEGKKKIFFKFRIRNYAHHENVSIDDVQANFDCSRILGGKKKPSIFLAAARVIRLRAARI